MATVEGRTPPTYDEVSVPGPDPLEQWASERDVEVAKAPALQHVSTETVGYEDLDTYGAWRESKYGAVWVPTQVDSGWAPYRHGHWAWIRPWGWTWVEDSPWGFAPFHYGRWAYVDGHWGWTPGALAARPCYAPALVGFVGGAPGASVSVTVGWFPLGPREAYYPSYTTNVGYVHSVNVAEVNVTNVSVGANVTYLNRGVGGAVTTVPANVMANGQPVAPAHTPMAATQISGAVTAAPAVQPNAAAVAPPATANGAVAHRSSREPSRQRRHQRSIRRRR
jgi:hypothetical protein